METLSTVLNVVWVCAVCLWVILVLSEAFPYPIRDIKHTPPIICVECGVRCEEGFYEYWDVRFGHSVQGEELYYGELCVKCAKRLGQDNPPQMCYIDNYMQGRG